MIDVRQRHLFSILSVLVLVLLLAPFQGRGEETGKGSLIGYVYARDQITPVADAVLVLKNVESGQVIESGASNELGMLTLKDIDAALYMAGIRTETDRNFNIHAMLGIKDGEIGKAVFTLVQEQEQEQTQDESGEKDKRCPKGESYVPAVDGECDEGYKWNAEGGECECIKRKAGLIPFLFSPGGVATVAAVGTATSLAIVNITGETTPVSPARN